MKSVFWPQPDVLKLVSHFSYTEIVKIPSSTTNVSELLYIKWHGCDTACQAKSCFANRIFIQLPHHPYPLLTYLSITWVGINSYHCWQNMCIAHSVSRNKCSFAWVTFSNIAGHHSLLSTKPNLNLVFFWKTVEIDWKIEPHLPINCQKMARDSACQSSYSINKYDN